MNSVSQLLSNQMLLRLFEVVDRRSENRMTEFGMLAQAFEFCKINGVAGDYFEFGVWQGKTFGYARTMARRYGYGPVTFRAFDSFQGLPPVTDSKGEIWREGQFAFSRAEFEANLEKMGFGKREYTIVEGFFHDSLTAELTNTLDGEGVKAAVVYVDCDLYGSTRDALAFVRPFLQDGTVICFDDYYNYKGRPDEGEQKAFGEFRAQHAGLSFVPYMAYAPLGMSFIAHL